MNMLELIELSTEMIQQDAARNKAFKAYADQYHLRWSLPPELEKLDWIRKAVVTDPHDSFEAARRLLASGKVHIQFQPYLPDDANRQKANEIETVLSWALSNADARKRVTTLAEITKSALLYDAVALQVVDLEHQFKLSQRLKRSNQRMKAALQYGRFTVNVYQPTHVHALASSYGTECVLLAERRRAREVGKEWNNKKLIELGYAPVTYYDFIDYEQRGVWVGAENDPTDNLVLVDPDTSKGKHKMEFLPWVALMGSSGLEETEEFMYHPMLFASHFSGAWETMNAVRTVAASLGIARGGAPVVKEEGPNPQAAVIDYQNPNRPIKAAPGNVVTPFATPPLEPGLMELGDRFGTELQRSTIGEILRGGHLPSGVSFSALNLATQTAAAQLRPAKDLAERALAEMFRMMLLWTEWTGVALEGYNAVRKSKMFGSAYVIEPEEVDPTGLYVSVNIDPQVPTDKMAAANTAIMLVNAGMLSKEHAMEQVGVDDPLTELEIIAAERYRDHLQALDMQREMQQVASEAQMAQAAQQQQLAIASQQMAMQGPIPGGQGFNPAQGGTPPVQATAPQFVNPLEGEAEEYGIPTGMEGL